MQESNSIHTKVHVEGFGELVKSWRDLEPLLEDPLLPLKLNSLRPFDESGQISLRWQSPTNPKLLWVLLEQWIGAPLSGKELSVETPKPLVFRPRSSQFMIKPVTTKLDWSSRKLEEIKAKKGRRSSSRRVENVVTKRD